jgi:hypothetical protein
MEGRGGNNKEHKVLVQIIVNYRQAELICICKRYMCWTFGIPSPLSERQCPHLAYRKNWWHVTGFHLFSFVVKFFIFIIYIFWTDKVRFHDDGRCPYGATGVSGHLRTRADILAG